MDFHETVGNPLILESYWLKAISISSRHLDKDTSLELFMETAMAVITCTCECLFGRSGREEKGRTKS